MSIHAFIIGAVTPDSPIPEMPASVSIRIWVCDAEGRILISVILTLPRSAAARRSSGARMPVSGRAKAVRRKSRRCITAFLIARGRFALRIYDDDLDFKSLVEAVSKGVCL